MSPEKINYPSQAIEVVAFPSEFGALFPKPAGLIDNHWPPDQVAYLELYLQKLECKTIICEQHYVDRDYIYDLSVFYARSLRNYPNYCSRLHFFSRTITKESWDQLFSPTVTADKRAVLAQDLQKHYLGFSVVKPLPGSRIGRTVIKTYPSEGLDGKTRAFEAVRKYNVHLAGYEFIVAGLAFQQQDQGVSACATTALWSSLHKVAHDERITIPTPSHITEAASRYLLAEGRSLPSEGLNLQQICEAIRGTGLQPVVVKSVSFEEDRAQLAAYINSGFPPVLAIQSATGQAGHAVCGVGLKCGDLNAAVAPKEHPNHVNEGAVVEALYVHDDRLGPYAVAQLQPKTTTKGLLTSIVIEWPDKAYKEESMLKAIIVPVPDKIRMPVARVLALGAIIAEMVGIYFNTLAKPVQLSCRYAHGATYREQSFEFGLSGPGLSSLCRELVLPRFLGLIQISSKNGPTFDVLLDTTETRANPSALAFVRRASGLSPTEIAGLIELAKLFGAQAIV